MKNIDIPTVNSLSVPTFGQTTEVKNITDFTKAANLVDTAVNVEVRFKDPNGKPDTTWNRQPLADDYKGIYNIERKQLAGIVSNKYAIIQHKDVIEAVSGVVDKLGMTVHGNIKQYQHSIYGTFVFMDKDMKTIDDNSKDGIRLGFRFANSYDRSRTFKLEMYGYRLVCENGMMLGTVLNNIVETQMHVSTGGKDKTFEDISNKVESFMHNVISSSSALQDYINNAMVDSIGWKVAEKVIERLLYSKKHKTALTEILKENHKDLSKLTRWDVYNALTQYASHNKKISPMSEQWLQTQGQKILKTTTTNLVAQYVEQ